jgi:hypothetical protein
MSPLPLGLRTVHERFPSYGSSLGQPLSWVHPYRMLGICPSQLRSFLLILGFCIATLPDTFYPTVGTSADPAYYRQALASDPILLPYTPACEQIFHLG